MIDPDIFHQRLVEIGQSWSLPTLLADFMRLSHHPGSDAGDFEQLIRRDPVVAARVLKVANSAYYGRSGKIATVRHAVVLLGLDTLRTILISLAFHSTLVRLKSPALDYRLLWRHSIAVATGTRLLAQMVRLPSVEEAFLAGLLHDLGKLLIDQIFPTEFARALREAITHQMPLFLAEAMTIGHDHAEIGGWAADIWKLPPTLVDSIASHHAPETDRKEALLPPLAYAANLLAHQCAIHGEKVALSVRKDPSIEAVLPGLQEELPAIERFFIAEMDRALMAYGSLEDAVA